MDKFKLDRQERAGVIVAGCALLLILAGLLYIPAGPLKDYRESGQRVARLETDLNMTLSLLMDEQDRVASQQWMKDALDERGPGFSLLAFLDRVKQQAGLEGARLQNQPPPRGVDNVELVHMEISSMSLSQWLDLLHAVYSSGNLIVVYNMSSLSPSDSGRGLEARVTFLTIKPQAR